jgi:hypothetical protein
VGRIAQPLVCIGGVLNAYTNGGCWITQDAGEGCEGATSEGT